MKPVCRVCGADKGLHDLFSNPQNVNVHKIRFIIWLATGVDIKETDTVSKMVCQQCCEIAIKLNKYRSNAVNNDRILKEQSGQPYEPPPLDPDEIRKLDAQMVNELFGMSDHISNKVNSKKHQNLTVEKAHQNVKTCNQKSVNDLSLRTNHNSSEVTIRKQEPDRKLEQRPSALSSNISSHIPKTTNVVRQTARKKTTSNITTKQCFQNKDEIVNETKPKTSLLLDVYYEQDQIVNAVSHNITRRGESPNKQVETVNKEKRKIINISRKRGLHNEPDQIVNEAKTKSLGTRSRWKSHNKQHEIVNEEKTKFSYRTRNRGLQDEQDKIVNKEETKSFNKTRKQVSYNKQDKIVNEKKTNSLNIIKKPELQNEHDVIANEENTKNGDTNRKRRLDEILNEITSKSLNVTRKEPGSQYEQNKNGFEEKTKCLNHARNEEFQDEVAKKKRKTTDINNLVVSDFGENDLLDTTICTPNKIEPSLYYADSENMMSTGKVLLVHLCAHCNSLFHTKKELVHHEKIHLTCKFCKVAFENFELLGKHQKGFCHTMIAKCLPSLQLIRVDSIPSIVNNYPEAFLDMKSEPNIAAGSSESTNDNDALSQISCLNTDNMANEDSPESSNYNNASFQIYCLNTDYVANEGSSQSTTINNPSSQISCLNTDHVVNADHNEDSIDSTMDNNISSQISCLNTNNVADEDDEEIKRLGVTKDPNTYINWHELINKTIEKCYFEKNFNEEKMINALFRKYSFKKTDRSLETNPTPNNFVDYSVSNYIQINHFTKELEKYKVPINYEYNDGVSATFMKHQLKSKDLTSSEWKNKNVVDLVKPSAIKPAPLTNNQQLQIKNHSNTFNGKVQQKSNSNTTGVCNSGGNKKSYVVPILPAPARLLQVNNNGVLNAENVNSNNIQPYVQTTNQTPAMLLQSNYNKQPNPTCIQTSSLPINPAAIATFNFVTLPTTSSTFVDQNSTVQSSSVPPSNQTQPYSFINIVPSLELTSNHTKTSILSQPYQQNLNNFIPSQAKSQNLISRSTPNHFVQILESTDLLSSISGLSTQLQYNQNTIINNKNINNNIFVVHPTLPHASTTQNEQTFNKTNEYSIPSTENIAQVAVQNSTHTATTNDAISSIQSSSAIAIGTLHVKGLWELN